VHERRRDVCDAVQAREHGLVARQEPVVRPVVRDEGGEALAALRAQVTALAEAGVVEGDVDVLPPVPGLRGVRTCLPVGARQATRVRVDDALTREALAGLLERVPLRREHASHALGDPVDLLAARRRDGHQGQRADARRVLLRVREGEGGAPRDPGDDPVLDVQVLPDRLDVGDQPLRGVVGETVTGLGDERPAAAAGALVDADQAVPGRVEVGPVPAAAERTAGAAVQPERGDAVGGAGLLPVQGRAVADVEHPGGGGFGPRVRHGSTVASRSVAGTHCARQHRRRSPA
jgi:hypothetical protein